MEFTKMLDAKGLSCPMPIVRTKKEMDGLETGEVLQVVLTDKGALMDIPAWSKASGHTIMQQEIDGDTIIFYIRKG